MMGEGYEEIRIIFVTMAIQSDNTIRDNSHLPKASANVVWKVEYRN